MYQKGGFKFNIAASRNSKKIWPGIRRSCKTPSLKKATRTSISIAKNEVLKLCLSQKDQIKKQNITSPEEL